MTKLNKKKIKWLVDQVVKNNKYPSEVSSVYNVSTRRVQQLVKSYHKTKKYPDIIKSRRPKTFLTDSQKEAIIGAFHDHKLSPRLLYYELKRRNHKIPKNKLYSFLKEKGLVIPDPKKQKKRKRCRYERIHSGSLLHGDGHRTSIKHPYCILWLDDASRKLLAGRETKEAINNQTSIETMQEAINHAETYNVTIRQVNTDRGPEFFSNQKEKNPKSKSKFEKYLIEMGIKHIPSRRNNPQTNGKIERHWREYDKHRWSFKSLREYIEWYNRRLHGALNLDWAETPNEAFIRKMRQEEAVGLFFKRLKNGRTD